MHNKEMLAVRLPSELINEVRTYAAENNKTMKCVIEDFIRFGLEENFLDQLAKYNWTHDVRRRVYVEHLKSIRNGERPYAADKKMLAVRLPSPLIQSLKDHSVQRQQNINTCVEAFIRLQLARQKGGESDIDILTHIHYFPFRKRRNESRDNVHLVK